MTGVGGRMEATACAPCALTRPFTPADRDRRGGRQARACDYRGASGAVVIGRKSGAIPLVVWTDKIPVALRDPLIRMLIRQRRFLKNSKRSSV